MAQADLSPEDRDLVTRTLLGEAGNQGDEGQSAVAHVILNRLAAGNYGRSAGDIVLAPKQFSAWNDPRGLMAIDQNSKEYKRAAGIVDKAASGGEDDPTSGATHFLNPALIKGKLPSWANASAQTAQVGAHSFFAPGRKVAASGTPADDLLGAWSTGGGSDRAPSQAAPSQTEDLLGGWKTAPAEAATSHIDSREGEELPESVVRWMKNNQGDTPVEKLARAGAGVVRGVGDVADTLAQGISYVGDKGAQALSSAGVISPEAANRVSLWREGINSEISRNNAAWNAASQGSALAETGRVGGEIAATAPFLRAAAATVPAAVRTFAASRPLTSTVLGGASTGGITSALTSSTSDQPLSQQVATGAAIGGAAGPLGYGLGRGLNALAQSAGLDNATAQLANLARNQYGIRVGPGQMSGSPMVRFLDSVLQRTPFSGHAADVAERQGAFNRAVAATMGENADRIDASVMSRAKANLGNTIETELPHLEAHLNPAVKNRIQGIADATDYLPAEDARIVNKLKDDMLAQFTGVSAKAGAPSRAVGPGIMSGKQIQAMITTGSPLDRAINSGSANVRNYASQLKDALLDAVGQTPTGRPKTAQAYLQHLNNYQDARFKYKNMKTIEDLVEKSPTGDISPASLMGAVRGSFGNMAYGGGGDLADLARIGQRFLKEPPSSGTSERLASMYGLVKVGAGVAGLGGAYYLDPEDFQRNALIGAGLLSGARATSSALRSNWLANALIRNAPGMPPSRLPQSLAERFNRAGPPAALLYRDRPQSSFDERFAGVTPR